MCCKSEAAACVQRIRISGAQHLIYARFHFGFFNEVVPIGLRDSFAHGGAKSGVCLKQA